MAKIYIKVLRAPTELDDFPNAPKVYFGEERWFIVLTDGSSIYLPPVKALVIKRGGDRFFEKIRKAFEENFHETEPGDPPPRMIPDPNYYTYIFFGATEP